MSNSICKNRLCQCLVLLVLCLTTLSASAQADWHPTGVWPFVHKKFQFATVYTGLINRTKTQVLCNIHVGKQSLWYTQNDTLMEAIPGTVICVEFPNGETYMPVGREQRFGRIVREDTIQGAIARLICIEMVNQRLLDEKYQSHLNKTQNNLIGMLGEAMDSYLSAVADTDVGMDMESEPLPMTNEFYFQVKGELFPATTKNILAHINPKRKGEYRNFTRSAEIISTNESSMLRIWKEFFLKW